MIHPQTVSEPLSEMFTRAQYATVAIPSMTHHFVQNHVEQAVFETLVIIKLIQQPKAQTEHAGQMQTWHTSHKMLSLSQVVNRFLPFLLQKNEGSTYHETHDI